MSVGTERVRVNFNPSSSNPVMYTKQKAAELIDEMLPLRDLGGEQGRCAAIAMTKYEEAAMWAVKALTAE